MAPGVAKLTAMELVRRRGLEPSTYLMPSGSTIFDAVQVLVVRRIGHIMIENAEGRISGMVTARDILRAIYKHSAGVGADDILNGPVETFATPSSQLVHVSGDDTLLTCSMIMSELKVRVLPVVNDGVLKGMLTLKEIADAVNHNLTGGKENYVRQILPRRGASIRTERSMAESSDEEEHNVVPERTLPNLALRTGLKCIPGPGKLKAEDAHIIQNLRWPHRHGDDVTYLGIADGVGSWAGSGVDPANFSTRLMSLVGLVAEQHADEGGEPPSPVAVLIQAWEAIQTERVTGSSTALIGGLDHAYNQFATANLGDSGALVLRKATTSSGLGTMDVARGGELGAWDVVFRTGQQLRSFNQPYQLGYADGASSGEGEAFDRPESADVARTPVQEGDILVLASDGLFDNMHEDELLQVVENWEDKWGDEAAQGQGSGTDDCMERLASALADRAFEFSMDRGRDGPFAQLAKENDILWSHGGRLDDITVLCARVAVAKQLDD